MVGKFQIKFEWKKRKFSIIFRLSQKKSLRAKIANFPQNFWRSSNIKKVFPKEIASFLQNFRRKGHKHGPYSTNSKVVLLTGHFRGLIGFRAKDLTFEAKAEDFKICSQQLPTSKYY